MPLIEIFAQTVQPNSVWELGKGIMISVGSAAGVGSFLMVLGIRDTVRDTRRDLRGENGDNGLVGTIKDYGSRLGKLEAWKIAEDAVTEVEHHRMEAVGRHPERLRDELHTGERSVESGYRYKRPEPE